MEARSWKAWNPDNRQRVEAMTGMLPDTFLSMGLEVLDCTNQQLGNALRTIHGQMFGAGSEAGDMVTNWFNVSRQHDSYTNQMYEFSTRLRADLEDNLDGNCSMYAESMARNLTADCESIQTRFGYQWADAEAGPVVVTAFDMLDGAEHQTVRDMDKQYDEAAAIIIRVHTALTGVDPRFL